jgi:photosystem II stability/assembly factor-like uncharacterized protein
MFRIWRKLGLPYLLVVCFLSPVAGKSLDEYGDTIRLSGIPAPFCISRYCVQEGEASWAVGGGGQILLRAPDGKITESRPTKSDLQALFFVNPDQGWAVGTKGTLLRTQDRGLTWTAQNSNATDDLESITCATETTCWAVGRNGIILRTKDGGQRWERIETGCSKDLFAVDFINEKFGWAAGQDGILLRTQDGGGRWEQFQAPIILFPGSSFEEVADLQAVKFFNADIGLVAGTRGIARSIDGGKTWNTIVKNHSFIGFVSHDAQMVWAISSRGTNYCSKDSGEHWGKCQAKKD